MSENSTLEEPLLFFEHFILGAGYLELKKEFYDFWEHSVQLYPDDVFINYNEEFVIHYFDYDEMNLRIPTELHFTEHLKKRLAKEIQNSKRLIRKGINSVIFSNNSPITYIQNLENIIIQLPNERRDLLLKYLFLQKYLKLLTNFINEQKQTFQIKYTIRKDLHDTDILIDINKQSSIELENTEKTKKIPFFGITYLEYDFFMSFTQLLFKYGIIATDESINDTTNRIFAIFKSPMPWKLNKPMHFLVDNLEVALIFKELRSIIPKLTYANIQKSNCFYKNKNNLPFMQTDISTPLSKAKHSDFNTIDPDFKLFMDDLKKLVHKELKKRVKKVLKK